MPKEALIILIPFAVLAFMKWRKHEIAAGDYIGNRFQRTQTVMKYTMVVCIAGVASFAELSALGLI